MPEITKNQHFVPQFYLKHFADEKKFVKILDLKNNRFCNTRPYPGVAYKPYFYAIETGIADDISQHIEKWLQLYESIIANELPIIIANILNFEKITDDEKYILSALICLMWLRSPQMRDQLQTMKEDMMKKMMRFWPQKRLEAYSKSTGILLTQDEQTAMIEMLESGAYNLKFNNAHHLRFMTDSLGFGSPGFTNLFFAHKWKIYIAKGSRKFLTTDSPVVEWWPPPKTFYGPSFLERNKYFALTPQLFVELTYPHGSEKIKRKTLFEENNTQIDIFNILLAAHAQNYAYSSDKELLERLLEGRKKHGKAEQEYYFQYEHPWELHRGRS